MKRPHEPATTTSAIIDMSIRAEYINALLKVHTSSNEEEALINADELGNSSKHPNRDIFSQYTAEEIIAHVLERRGWDERDGQLDMVDLIDTGENCVISAPVGIGKTLGYLIPALLNNAQVMVATSTKALQEQISDHEMPRLCEDLTAIYGFTPRWTILKGKSNYLDYDKFRAWLHNTDTKSQLDVGVTPQIVEAVEAEQQRLIAALSDPACHGYDSETFSQTLPKEVWAIMCATDTRSQWVTHTYLKAYGHSELIIANSAYAVRALAQVEDIGLITGAIPQMIIFDEAHHLQDIATEALSTLYDPEAFERTLTKIIETHSKSLGRDITTGARQLLRLIEASHQWVPSLYDSNNNEKQRFFIQSKLKPMVDAYDVILNAVELNGMGKTDVIEIQIDPGLTLSKHPKTVKVKNTSYVSIMTLLDALGDMAIVSTFANITDKDTKTGQERFAHFFSIEDKSYDTTRTTGTPAFGLSPIYIDHFGRLATRHMSNDEIIRTTFGLKGSNTDGDNASGYASAIADAAQELVKRGKFPTLTEAVGHIGLYVDDSLFDQRQVVLCSGTISDKVRPSLGLSTFVYEKMVSPFNPEHARIYVPGHIKEPKAPEWIEQFIDLCIELITESDGRAMILTSSYRTMNATYEALKNHPALHDLNITLMCQGQAPKNTIISQFKDDERSVLVGTKTFWEGVDVPGSALQLVIIDKIPFPAPTTSVRAREEYAKRTLGERAAFAAVSILDASQMLAQAAGRLIRSEYDLGTIVVADPRLASANYRHDVMSLLPPGTKLTTSFDTISKWMKTVLNYTLKEQQKDEKTQVSAGIENVSADEKQEDLEKQEISEKVQQETKQPTPKRRNAAKKPKVKA